MFLNKTSLKIQHTNLNSLFLHPASHRDTYEGQETGQTKQTQNDHPSVGARRRIAQNLKRIPDRIGVGLQELGAGVEDEVAVGELGLHEAELGRIVLGSQEVLQRGEIV